MGTLNVTLCVLTTGGMVGKPYATLSTSCEIELRVAPVAVEEGVLFRGEMLPLSSYCDIQFGTVKGIRELFVVTVVCSPIIISPGFNRPGRCSGAAWVTISGRVPGVFSYFS